MATRALPAAPTLAPPFSLVATLRRPATLLGCLVAASFAARLYASASRPTAMYLPDEYLYRSLAESIAASGKPLVRGAQVYFPGLLEPLLAAPFWLGGDPEVAYRLTQGLHSLTLSLAAVPAYLLARRLALRPSLALAISGIAVATPNLRYAAFILADPIAYPLVLAAACAGVAALARPSVAAQVAFLALAGLATFARVQFAILPLAFFAAAVVVERGRLRTVIRELRLSFALVALAGLALAAFGAGRFLDVYSGLDNLDSGASVLRWLASDALLLPYAAGWVLVPGALVGLALGLARPRSRTECAFAAFTGAFALLLLLEAALVAAVDSERFQERYLFSLLPLLAIAFCLSLRPGGRIRVAVGGLALLLLAVSARIPLAGYTAHGSDDSPTLVAVLWIEQSVGVGTGSLLMALACGALSVAALAGAARPRLAAPLGLGLALTVAVCLSLVVTHVDGRNSRFARDAYLPADRRWVDDLALGSVSLLQPPGASSSRALNHLFWNSSVDRVLLLGGGSAPDGFGAERATVARDGSLLVDGAAVRRPLLVQTYGSSVTFAGGDLLARAPGFEVWRPAPILRLLLLASGRYSDGWLAGSGAFTVWQTFAKKGRKALNFSLSLPDNKHVTTIRLHGPDYDRRVSLDPGETRAFSVPLSEQRPWTLRFQAERLESASDGRFVSVRSTRPCVRLAGRPARESCS